MSAPVDPASEAQAVVAARSALFRQVRLPRIRFEDANLLGAEFEDVNLRGAFFSDVALSGARFRNVCLGDVTIDDANYVGMRIDGILVTDLLKVYREKDPGEASGGTASDPEKTL